MPSALGAGRSQIPSLLMIVNIAGILYLLFRGALRIMDEVLQTQCVEKDPSEHVKPLGRQ